MITNDSPDSPTLAGYIEAEIRVETRKQYPELNSMEETPEMLKSLNVLSNALARAIKKYLNQDVKTVQLGLQVDPTTLLVRTTTSGGGSSRGELIPNPHSHSINPHRHDITAP